MKITFIKIIALFAVSAQVAGASVRELPLPNGSFMMGERDQSLPRNNVHLTFQGGAALLSPENQGVAPILTLILEEGPSSMTPEKYKQRLFEMGASVSPSFTTNTFTLSVSVLPENQTEVLALVAELLKNPRVNESEFKRQHAKQVSNTKSRFENMQAVISYLSWRHLFKYAPQVMSGHSSPNTLEKLAYKTFKAEYQKLLDPTQLVVGYVGPNTLEDTKSAVEISLADLLKSKSALRILPLAEMPKIVGTSYVLVDKPGATDNQILFLYPQSIKRDGAEWVDGMIAQNILGGGSSGKLHAILRSERGLTYAAQSAFRDELPLWYVWTFGGIEQVKELLTGVPEVIAAYKKSAISPVMFSQAKSRILMGYKKEFELASSRLSETMWFKLKGLDVKAFENFEKTLSKASLGATDKVHKNLQSQNGVIYIMGDKSKMIPILTTLGVATEKVEIIAESAIR